MEFGFSTQNTSNTQQYHFNMNFCIIFKQIRITPFYRLTPKHVRLLQERTQDSPTASCHHWRPPPVKAVITHVNIRDSLANPEPLSPNCFVHNIYPLSQTNIRSKQPQVRDRYTNFVYDCMIYNFRVLWHIFPLSIKQVGHHFALQYTTGLCYG